MGAPVAADYLVALLDGEPEGTVLTIVDDQSVFRKVEDDCWIAISARGYQGGLFKSNDFVTALAIREWSLS